ncbi:flagellar motor switch protein FliM [Pseudalkalibacillus caeni]
MLSEREVDAILASLSTEEETTKYKKVQAYDFKRALRFSQDQIRVLTRIHENYARLMTNYTSAQLRTIVQASIHSVTQSPFDEYVKSIKEKSINSLFTAAPLQGQMVMEVQSNLASVMLDRMLGGQGFSTERSSHLTEIETIVMERLFNKILESFRDAWTSILKMDTELKELEVNPHFLQIVSPNETVIVVNMDVTIGQVTGRIRICLPHVVLEPIMPRLTAHHGLSNQKKERQPEEAEVLQKRVKKTMMEIKAELGRSEINIEEFLNLSAGDVIRLQETIDDPVILKVDRQPKFFGQPGKSKGKMAVQITEVLDGEESDQ